MSLLTQRVNHRKKLDSLNAKVLDDYPTEARVNGIAVKMKHSAKRVQSLDEAGESTTSYDHQTMPSMNKTTHFSVTETVESTSIHPTFQQPISSSTPIKVSSSKRVDFTPVQPTMPQLVHLIGPGNLVNLQFKTLKVMTL